MDLSLIELVTEALEERSFMLDSMPFMAKPLPIMLPCYSWWEIPFYFAGMKVYDLFAGREAHCPGAYVMSKEQTMCIPPLLILNNSNTYSVSHSMSQKGTATPNSRIKT
jgi:glycerol-3-phosphate dehydrogenase